MSTAVSSRLSVDLAGLSATASPDRTLANGRPIRGFGVESRSRPAVFLRPDNLPSHLPVVSSRRCFETVGLRGDEMSDLNRGEWVTEIQQSIADLERYRLKAEASGYYDMANRLKDQIGELEKRVAEIQKHAG
jgi:hypothetical protein